MLQASRHRVVRTATPRPITPHFFPIIGEVKSENSIFKCMTELEEYIEEMYNAAESLWGREEAEKMRQHIESTASAVYRVGQLTLDTAIEPATRLRHREQP